MGLLTGPCCWLCTAGLPFGALAPQWLLFLFFVGAQCVALPPGRSPDGRLAELYHQAERGKEHQQPSQDTGHMGKAAPIGGTSSGPPIAARSHGWERLGPPLPRGSVGRPPTCLLLHQNGSGVGPEILADLLLASRQGVGARVRKGVMEPEREATAMQRHPTPVALRDVMQALQQGRRNVVRCGRRRLGQVENRGGKLLWQRRRSLHVSLQLLPDGCAIADAA
mmetsp:Transcript_124581/g.346923  ORF Transcript_124581/g.346923 Transcript_124581/m.346923 type:complete len:223 (+) Transcript_124581:952-1620(+)